MVRWESDYLDKGRVIVLRSYPCIFAPLLDGPNLKCEASWSYFQLSKGARTISGSRPPDKMVLTISNPETVEGSLRVGLYGGGFIIQSIYAVHIPVKDNEIVRVGLSDNATTFTRNL